MEGREEEVRFVIADEGNARKDSSKPLPLPSSLVHEKGWGAGGGGGGGGAIKAGCPQPVVVRPLDTQKDTTGLHEIIRSLHYQRHRTRYPTFP